MELSGGRDGISKQGDVIHRPANSWTKDVHNFLNYLHDCGFNQVPKPVGIEGDTELVSFVQGDVHNEGLPAWMLSDETLVELAHYIRKFHDLGQVYVKRLSGDETWMLPIKEPVETMCHGDLAPYNLTTADAHIVGMIDFDTCHPGPVIWELAYTAYRIIPLMDPKSPESFGTKAEQLERLDVFIKAYGIDVSLNTIIKTAIKRLEALVQYMRTEAEAGDETFKGHIEAGHVAGYLRDIEYMRTLID